MSQHFEAGQLHKFVYEWHKLTSDQFILNMVQHCHLDIDEDNIEHLFSEDLQYVFREEETVIIHQVVTKLLQLKAIKATHRQEHQILSPIFLRKNKTIEWC